MANPYTPDVLRAIREIEDATGGEVMLAKHYNRIWRGFDCAAEFRWPNAQHDEFDVRGIGWTYAEALQSLAWELRMELKTQLEEVE